MITGAKSSIQGKNFPIKHTGSTSRIFYKIDAMQIITLAIGLILSASFIAGADNTPVTVMITQRTPIESLAPDGSVTGVNEAAVGTRF